MPITVRARVKPMTPLRIALRAVFYREEAKWVAHCLEFDLIGHGKTKEEALRTLCKAIALQVQFSIEHENLDNLFTPADGKYLRMFAAGKRTNIAKGEMKLHFEPVTIEGVDVREYSASDTEFAPTPR